MSSTTTKSISKLLAVVFIIVLAALSVTYVYAVTLICDRWFGDAPATISGQSHEWDGTITAEPDFIYGSHFTHNESGSICNIRVLLDLQQGYSYHVKCAFYDHSDNTTQSNWWTEERTLSGYGQRYETFDFDPKPNLPSGEYWILIWHDGGGPGDGKITYWYTTNASGRGGYSGNSYGGWPSPIVWDQTNTKQMLIWAEYDLPNWLEAEVWWGLLGTPIWQNAETWLISLYAEWVIISLPMLRIGMFIGGLSLVFGPILYAGHKGMSLSMEEAISILLMVFGGIGILMGFTYWPG